MRQHRPLLKNCDEGAKVVSDRSGNPYIIFADLKVESQWKAYEGRQVAAEP